MSDKAVERFEPWVYEAAPGDKRTAGQVATPSTPRDAGVKTSVTQIVMPDTSKHAAEAPSVRVGGLTLRLRVNDGPFLYSGDRIDVFADGIDKPLRGDAALAAVFHNLLAAAPTPTKGRTK
jgi:hypothetical protein